MMAVNLVVLSLCAGAIATFFLYPAFVWIAAAGRPRRRPDGREPLPPVTVLVAVRNGESVIEAKIANTLSLDYAPDLLRLVVVSDGSTDGTNPLLRGCRDPRVTSILLADHEGKAEALNRGLDACRGEVVVFSDADAILEPGAVQALVRHFDDPRVGGVCGRRVIAEKGQLGHAQSSYIGFDSTIKVLESRLGRITSNDGKLYAVRRALARPIPAGVTDDLYSALAVIERGAQFVFEPEARAAIRQPSRSPMHEVQRRRRIVARSLRGIFMARPLLNPGRYGLFAVGLWVNKVLRRMLGVLLALVLVATIGLAQESRAAAALLALQVVFYAAAAAYPVARLLGGPAARLLSIPFYVCIGCYGSTLGLADFLRGRTVTRWDPRKAGS